MRTILMTMLGLLMIVCLIHAQDANVVTLSDQDAAKAKLLWQAKLDAEKAFMDYSQEIAKKYIGLPTYSSESDNCSGVGGQYYRKGFGCGHFVFSTDFKHIVPEPSKPTTNQYSPFSLIPAL